MYHNETVILVAFMRNEHIGSFYRQQRQQHIHRPILRMTVSGVSRMLHFASWVMYVPIGCTPPFTGYWQSLGAKTTATGWLQHPDYEHQWNVNTVRYYISGNQGITQIFMHITTLLTALIGKNRIYQRKNMDSKLMNIENCTTCKNTLFVVENVILIRYY